MCEQERDQPDQVQKEEAPSPPQVLQPTITLSSAEFEDLRSKASQAEGYLNALKRARADLINYQERVKREKEELWQYAIEKFIYDFLPVVDAIQKSIAMCSDIAEAKATVEGLQLLEKEVLRILAKHNVYPIETDSKQFDPNYHEAVLVEETDEGPDMRILTELRRGYMIHNRVLRPAQVKIAKKREQQTQGQ